MPCEQLYSYSYLDKEHGGNPPGARIEILKRWSNVFDKVERWAPPEWMKLESGLSSDEARERILDTGVAISKNICRLELAKTLGIE